MKTIITTLTWKDIVVKKKKTIRAPFTANHTFVTLANFTQIPKEVYIFYL